MEDIITLPPNLLAHMGWDESTQLIAIVDGDSVILRRDEDVYSQD
jgi:hypothetical protein